MIISIIAAATVALGQSPALKCPVLGGNVAEKSVVVEYNGAKFSFCCGGCDVKFAKSPEKYLIAQRRAGKTVGVYLFDPVSKKRLDLKKAKATADYEAIRYPFESLSNKRTFLAAPKKYLKGRR